MHDHEYWIRIAEEDRTAIQTLRTGNGPWRIVVFLAQSAAEKYLKGFLQYHDLDPERTHDMEELLEECEKFDSSLSVLAVDCGNLSFFSVDARYPDFEGTYDEDSARRAIAASDRICNAIRERMK